MASKIKVSLAIPVLAVIACRYAVAQSTSAGQPLPFLPESRDEVRKEVRAARAKVFDFPAQRSIDVPEPGPFGNVSHIIVDLRHTPELPLEISDAVAIAEVAAAQPFPCASRSAIYTEFKAKVTEVVKGDIRPGDMIIILRSGGIARMDDGRVVETRVSGEGDPMEVSGRYLLFLGYYPPAEAFGIHKMWRVENGILKASFPEEKGLAGRHASEVDGNPVAGIVSLLLVRQQQAAR